MDFDEFPMRIVDDYWIFLFVMLIGIMLVGGAASPL